MFSSAKILNQDGSVFSQSELENKTIGLYFSAHWCPPCRGFTPVLAKRYKDLLANDKPLEIIFISSDSDEASAKAYFSEMPWKMLDYNAKELKASLSTKYGVSGIPSLILLDSKENILTKDGRSCIMKSEFERFGTWESDAAAAKIKLEEAISSMPNEVLHESHPHPLIKTPHVYRGSYGCDICKSGGSGWAYHCDGCGFDAHPACVVKM